MTTWAHVGEHVVTGVSLHVPPRGPWWADVDFEQAPALSGPVVLSLGTTDLHGVIANRNDGTFGLRRRSRIVGGAGGWGTLLEAQDYHNDAGVSALTIAQDAARDAGETLGTFTPAAPRLDVDYVRDSGPASRALEDALGGVPWWVDYAGVTQTGARASVDAGTGAYEVITQNPRNRMVEVALHDDDVSAIAVGTVLSEHLDAPQTVREILLTVDQHRVRMHVWCGGDASSSSRATTALRAIIARATDDALFGSYRYRVAQLAGDRVHLQPVRADAGLPTVLHISPFPGVAGAHAQLALGAEVLVTFVDGRRDDPVVTHFAGKDGTGWKPVSLLFDATAIAFGEGATSKIALADFVDARIDAVRTSFNGHTHTVSGGSTGVPVVALPSQASTASAKVSSE